MNSSPLKDYYRVLQLGIFESNQNTIKQAYLAETAKYRDAALKEVNLRENLIEINEAFLVLDDVESKHVYDNCLRDDKLPDEDFNKIIKSKHDKAVSFIQSYYSRKSRKKKSIWKVIGTVFLVMVLIGNIGKIMHSCMKASVSETIIPHSSSKSVGSILPPSDWKYYEIARAFSISIPPTLELRTEDDSYSQYVNENHLIISYADAVFQQAGLSDMDDKALKGYCRIIASVYYVEEDNAEHYTESPSLTKEDCGALREIADNELDSWSYIKEPQYEWIDINGTKGIDISYSRNGVEGEVLCHIYLFQNYDEIAKIVTAYRKKDNQIWGNDIDNVVRTFKWSNPKL